MEATLNRGLSLLVRCTLMETFLYRAYRGTSFLRTLPPPQDYRRALGIGLM